MNLVKIERIVNYTIGTATVVGLGVLLLAVTNELKER